MRTRLFGAHRIHGIPDATFVNNRLLSAEIIFSLVSMCASLGSLVAGLFGMILTNHLEEAETAWLHVTAATVAGTTLCAILIVVLFLRHELVSSPGSRGGGASEG